MINTILNICLILLFLFVLFMYLDFYNFKKESKENNKIVINNVNKNENVSHNVSQIDNERIEQKVDWYSVNKSLLESKRINKENSLFIDEIKKARREAYVIAQMYENKYKRIYDEVNVGICNFNVNSGLITSANKYFFNIYNGSEMSNKMLDDYKNGINIYNHIPDLYAHLNKKTIYTSNVVLFKQYNNKKIKVKISVLMSSTEEDEFILFINNVDNEYRLNEKLTSNIKMIYDLFNNLNVNLYIYSKNKGIIKILDKNVNMLVDLVNNDHDFASLNYYFQDEYFIKILDNNIKRCYDLKESNTYNIKNNNEEVTVCIVPLLKENQDILSIIIYPDNSKKKNYSKKVEDNKKITNGYGLY